MKSALSIFGVLILLVGLVWFLQGINILPGSYMTGDPQWAINGIIAMVIGTGIFSYSRRRKDPNG